MKLSRGARKLFDLIRWYAARFPEVFPLRSTLARRLKCSVATVGRWAAELKSLGLLLVSQAGPQAATYELQQPAMNQLVVSDNDRALSVHRSSFERPHLNTQFYSVRNSKQRPSPPERKPPEPEKNYILPHMREKYEAECRRLGLVANG